MQLHLVGQWSSLGKVAQVFQAKSQIHRLLHLDFDGYLSTCRARASGVLLALLLGWLSVFGSALSYGRGSRRCSFFSQVGLAVGALALGRGRIYVAAYGDSFCV